MKVYVDLVLVLNFLFDTLILITTAYILKRNVKTINFILGGLIGSLSTLFLFFNINSLELFIYKVILSILMNIITFSYKNIKYTLKNIFYFYIVSIILGGFLYFVNINMSYKHNGYIFYNTKNVNILILVIISPIILKLYFIQIKDFKTNISNYYKVKIYLNSHVINVSAYLDTGNNLKDPYLNRPVLILNKKKMIYDINEFRMILVPYNTIDNNGLLECIIPDKVEIKGNVLKNVLIGISNNKIYLDGVDLILNNNIKEILC